MVEPSPVGIGRIVETAVTQETTSGANEQPVYDATIPENGAVTQSDPTLELLRTADVDKRIALAQELHAMIKSQNGKGGPMGQPRQ